jgi:hypothetical protein
LPFHLPNRVRNIIVNHLDFGGQAAKESTAANDSRAILLSRFLPRSQQGRPALIELRPESPEELRKRLREMSDLELRRFGQRARKLSDPKMNLGATGPHVIELEAAREEWRRRHPKTP